MGNLSSSIYSFFWPPQPCRLLLLGLGSAGKTTLLYRLKPQDEELSWTMPTIGVNLETLRFRGTIIASWDVGGRGRSDGRFKSKILKKYTNLYEDVDGIIFMVDSIDKERLEQARDELHYEIDEGKLRGKPLLILCNKQDLPNAIPPTEISKYLALPQNTKWHAAGCSAKSGNGFYQGLDWMSKALQEEKEDAEIDSTGNDIPSILSSHSGESVIDIGYDVTEGGGNLTLQHFSVIKNGTECPFAKSANLWGGSPYPQGSTLEDQAKANVAALTEFVRQSQDGADLDGFCIELDDVMASEGGPKELGECVRRMLTTLSDNDPAGEQVMRKKYIGLRGWRFRFNKANFFITTFAPCYPPTSSRYAFGAGRAFLLLQPQASFGRHDLPLDTPDTNWDAPETVRDKTRVAFRDAGRGYHIPPTTRYPPAEHIVRPFPDDGISVVRWWEPAQDD